MPLRREESFLRQKWLRQFSCAIQDQFSLRFAGFSGVEKAAEVVWKYGFRKNRFTGLQNAVLCRFRDI
jgi:hypothetical protein